MTKEISYRIIKTEKGLYRVRGIVDGHETGVSCVGTEEKAHNEGQQWVESRRQLFDKPRRDFGLGDIDDYATERASRKPEPQPEPTIQVSDGSYEAGYGEEINYICVKIESIYPRTRMEMLKLWGKMLTR